jgi:hypothetical protein
MLRALPAIALIWGLMAGFALAAVEIGIEAEKADTIEAPMVVATPDEAAAQGGPKPNEPSGGKFIWMPGPPATGGGGKGFAEFNLNIPKAGTYAIWGRVIAWDGNSDSFWVTVVPPDPADQDPQQTGDTHYRWAVQQGNEWHWDKVNQWLDGGTFERKWDLPKGKVLLKIWTREDATMLDCLYITDNLSDDEAEVQPKLPSELATAVEPHEKLSTTWARIKSAR